MLEKQGYYSLIQYSEFPERNEFVNIGIVVFADDSPRVLMKFSKNSSRIKRVFGINPGKHFELLRDSIESRINSEFGSVWSKDRIIKFVGMQSGKLRISSPKSLYLENAQETLNKLFDSLVDGIENNVVKPRVQTILKKRFEVCGVEKLLERPESLLLPQGVSFSAPYAYQNGSYNFINAVSLRDEPNEALKSAGKYAVLGRWLSKASGSTKKLVVVGDVENQEKAFINAIDELMTNHSAVFYNLSEIEPLVDDIRENFIRHAQSSEIKLFN